MLGRRGRFWQDEYYDHLVRDEGDLARCVDYVIANPQYVGLKEWKWVGGSCSGRAGDPRSTGVPPVG